MTCARRVRSRFGCTIRRRCIPKAGRPGVGITSWCAVTDRLAVDFDNTLTTSNVAYWDGEVPEPDETVCEAVRQHYYSGGTVIVWTSRAWADAHLVAARLTEWQVPYHGIRCEKGAADVYVDDKAVTPDEWVSD